METGIVVLGFEIAALIAALHRNGVLPVQAVIDEMTPALPLQPAYRDALEETLQKLVILAGALGPFVPAPTRQSPTPL